MKKSKSRTKATRQRLRMPCTSGARTELAAARRCKADKRIQNHQQIVRNRGGVAKCRRKKEAAHARKVRECRVRRVGAASATRR